MKEITPPNTMENETFESNPLSPHYHSVEFSIQGVELAYQFKLWNISSTPMCVLVKEDSAILPNLKEGDTLDLKFYSSGTSYSTASLKTRIRHITRDQGRFRGHYLVALEIQETPCPKSIH
ncbi:MAG: hypothetical protein JW896_04210 [Deltaproteobacteria bacterium]|nr:hypothetical protein [Deltaproteobacteria bacterium]